MGWPYLLISMALRSHNIAITCDREGERGEGEKDERRERGREVREGGEGGREGGREEGGRETGHFRYNDGRGYTHVIQHSVKDEH